MSGIKKVAMLQPTGEWKQTTSPTGSWVDYTPVWGSTGTQPALGNGTLTGRYWRSTPDAGAMIFVTGRLVAGSTSTFGTGTYTVTLPITAANTPNAMSNWGWIFDTSAADMIVTQQQQSGTTKLAAIFTGTAGVYGLTSISPFTFANGDQWAFSAVYEAA